MPVLLLKVVKLKLEKKCEEYGLPEEEAAKILAPLDSMEKVMEAVQNADGLCLRVSNCLLAHTRREMACACGCVAA